MGDDKPTFDWLPEGMEALADGEYDAIVLGTGLKECVISGLLSVKGKRVLQLDRNGYYGGDGASLNLSNLFEKFQAGDAPDNLGANRDYNVDLIPKFIMACGNLTKMLLHTKVTRYLDFKSIAGSYVYSKGGKILKVPATPEEALTSPLMGLFEKRRFRKFLIYIDQYVADKPETHEGRDLSKMTMRELYTDLGLVPDTHQFISHAMCLQLDEKHMDLPAAGTVKELQCYMYSLSRYGTSPYIYPIYGLGGLPEGFSRICAIHGGTFMLNQDVDEILFEDGKATGVKAGNQMAKAAMVIGDPSYFSQDKIRPTGQVVRCICLLNHPIPNTNNGESAQIIIPGPNVGRQNDVFVCSMGHGLQATAPGIFVAIVSTIAEKGNPDEDVAPGLQVLGPILKRFTSVTTTYEPVADGSADKCYISKSFDATSHFEQDCDDLLSLYTRVTGEELDMNINADSVEGDY